MATFSVTIDGDRLEELQAVVATIRREQPQSTVTEQSYIEGIVHGHLDSRIVGAYQAMVRKKSAAELRALLGPRKDLPHGQ